MNEKFFLVDIAIGILMLALATLYPTEIMSKIINLLLILYGFFIIQIIKKISDEKKSNGKRKPWYKRMFASYDILDEREKLILLKTNNFLLVITVIIAYIIFSLFKDKVYFNQYVNTWFYAFIGLIIFVRGIVGTLYSKFLPLKSE